MLLKSVLRWLTQGVVLEEAIESSLVNTGGMYLPVEASFSPGIVPEVLENEEVHMTHKNVEIKARCSKEDHEMYRDLLLTLGARFLGTDHQTDTYFRTKEGRMKLREGNIEHRLVFYKRSDERGPKRSDVVLYDVEPEKCDILKEILLKACGKEVVVKKDRGIYFVGNVKFHLDFVSGLGTFVEIEAIDMSGNVAEEELYAQCSKYMEQFGIREEDLVIGSYSDLLIQGV